MWSKGIDTEKQTADNVEILVKRHREIFNPSYTRTTHYLIS